MSNLFMSNMINIFFEDINEQIVIAPNRKLVEICDEFNTPILFGCRACSCGTCLIEVTKGQENLSFITDEEKILLEVMAEGNDKARLACQCIVNGSISVKLLKA